MNKYHQNWKLGYFFIQTFKTLRQSIEIYTIIEIAQVTMPTDSN